MQAKKFTKWVIIFDMERMGVRVYSSRYINVGMMKK